MSLNFQLEAPGWLTVSDKAKKPPKTFEMTKVPLRNLKRY